MSPEKLRAAVEAATQDGHHFPWWSYALAFLLSMVGAYLGAYFKRKAEDRATQENFDRLREQLRKTTNDTEEIKSTLSRKNWLTQQQWTIREQHYMNLLANLTKLKLTLEDRDSYYIQPGSEHNAKLADGEHFQALAHAGHESYQAIRELMGPASVFLSSKTIESLEQLVRDHWSVAEFSACTAEYVSEALTLVQAAQSAVLAEARSELYQLQPDI
jgi:hypothetical protein